MIRNFIMLSEIQQKRVLEIYDNQMSAFGGKKQDYELKEVFKKDNMLCVRFKNKDWYHYSLHDGTWF